MNHSVIDNHSGSVEGLPWRVQVLEVVSSRYQAGGRCDRPQQWDNRIEGIDLVRVAGAGVIKLASSAMQSVPKVGWVLMLTSGDNTAGFQWTLYGMPRCQ